MNLTNERKSNYSITEEEAFNLLFPDDSNIVVRQDIFDEFGNYCFPLDYVGKAPNITVGTSIGLSYLDVVAPLK